MSAATGTNDGVRVMIMAGGTGGHVYPALAVARALIADGHDVVWLGTRQGIEARLVPAAGIAIEWSTVSGLRGKGVLALLLAPLNLLRALVQAWAALRRTRPAVVLGMGGFVSGPGGLAARMTGRPLVIHEQNSVAGTTNRILARIATRVLQAFPDSFEAVVAETVGNPVREEILALADAAHRSAAEDRPLRLLVLGGSQGASALNRSVPDAIAPLVALGRMEVRHQTGENKADETERAYADTGLSTDPRAMRTPYIEDMAEAYAWADLAVCRAGALTLAELTAAGLGAVLIPLPGSIDDHQASNARSLEREGAAVLLPQRELLAGELGPLLIALERDRTRCDAMGAAARALSRPDATRSVMRHCLALCPSGGAA
jgi:UDP-N-acetylglucosamine--N-acetylmuramyl-(pentapeptide) pyrophosphoryl-undecaprenol N-acetylglucosamine transferase